MEFPPVCRRWSGGQVVRWFYCVDRLGSTKTAIYANLIPFWTLLFAWLFIGEAITLLQILGGILILTGIYLTKLKRKLTTDS